ncbi:hypothetical protein M0805_009615 [Coniferiporia weirii]|nr:hypothetical protein M0805_009615 [Coniferiporia weirii]
MLTTSSTLELWIHTQLGESEHRHSKDNYKCTNKVNFVQQLTQIERRQAALHVMAECIESVMASDRNKVDGEEIKGRPDWHYGLVMRGKPINLEHWNFIQVLLDHVLMHAHTAGYDDDNAIFSDADRNTITIINNRMYEHKILQVNYTMYDMQCEYDSINLMSITLDMMVLSAENNAHMAVSLFWVEDHMSGDNVCQLDWISFIEDGFGTTPFGFVDPALVVRAVHLIPAFHYGCVDLLQCPSQLAQTGTYTCIIVGEASVIQPDFNCMKLITYVPPSLFDNIGYNPTSNSPTDVQMPDIEINSNSDDSNSNSNDADDQQVDQGGSASAEDPVEGNGELCGEQISKVFREDGVLNPEASKRMGIEGEEDMEIEYMEIDDDDDMERDNNEDNNEGDDVESRDNDVESGEEGYT